MSRKRPRADTSVSVLRLPRPSLADQIRAEVASWAIIRQQLFNVFKSFSEAGRMTAEYGQRTDEQIRAAIEYAREHGQSS